MPPFNPNIPQATDQISDSQNDLLNNFQSIQTLVDVNHITFDDPNQGKHFFVEMPQQAVANVTAAGEVGIQCLASAYTTTQGANAPTLVMLNQSGAAAIEMSSGLLAQPGWSFLPSGLLIKWGTFPAVAVGSSTYNFPAGPAYGTAIYNVILQPSDSNATLDPNMYVFRNFSTTTLTTIGYNVVARDSALPVAPSTIYYYVIGI